MRPAYTLIACITGMALAFVEGQWVVFVPLLLVGLGQAVSLVRQVRAQDEREEQEDDR
ncbi:hypothetical protein AGATL06_19410 [Agathobaculum sp. TL06]